MMNRIVVIVGGGIAGLAATWKLLQLGIKDILLMDAADYLGGRMKTITVGDTPINLGCNWFHFVPDHNALYTFALKHIPTLFEPAEKAHALKPSALFHDSYKLIIEPGIADEKALKTSLQELFSRCHAIFISITNSHDHSNEEPTNVLDKFEKKYFNELSKLDLNEDEKKLATAMFHSFLLTESWNQGTDLLNDVSVTGSGAPMQEVVQGSHVEVVKGYQEIVNYFASELGPQIICKSHKVEKVTCEPDKPNGKVSLNLRYIPPSGEKEIPMEIECDHVILAIPLTFLQENHNTMFTPPLPATKVDALNSARMGLVEKVCLEFTEPLNFSDDGSSLGVWPLYKLKWDENRNEWWRKFTSWSVKGVNKNIIIGTLVGEAAKAMNAETLEEVGKKCLNQLETMLGRKLQAPTSVNRSSWDKNPFVHGSYTSFKVDAVKDAANVLAAPICDDKGKPLVLFAGEHTSYTGYASVQGAFESGFREAERLGELLNKPKSK